MLGRSQQDLSILTLTLKVRLTGQGQGQGQGQLTKIFFIKPFFWPLYVRLIKSWIDEQIIFYLGFGYHSFIVKRNLMCALILGHMC